MPDLLTQREAADLLRCSERQIARYRASGRLPFQKLDNGVRIRRQHAEALLSTPVQPAAKSWQATRWTRDAQELPESLTRAPSRKPEFAA
jgi:excisionase family DNA binding protein